MSNSYLVIGVFSTILVLTSAKGVFNTCKDGYENMKDSTMCYKSDSENYIDGGVTGADKKVILAEHNKFRAAANPEASDLFKLYWDDAVAAVAQKLTQQCKMYHDKNRKVASLPGVYVGQNAAAGQRNWVATVGDWHSEVSFFEYGKGVNTSGKAIGHYTQVVNNKAIRIGCGFSKCSNGYKNFYVCNYAVGQYGTSRPYESGKQCAACPKHCTKDGLCDCAGLLCLNGGTLDKNNCKCKCKNAFGGKYCSETKVCGGKNCYNGGKLNKKDCTCKCPKNTSGKECEVFEDMSSGSLVCRWSNRDVKRSNQAKCKDTWACKTNGGPYGCDECAKYSNVPKDYCPVMCGLCDA